MATIRARKSADGSLRYTAQIRIKKNGMQVYQESQTFARKQAAQAWTKRRETELSEPGAIERAKRSSSTVASMIEKYLEEYGKARPIGKTKKATLEAIAKTYLGECEDRSVTAQVLVDYALWRMSGEGGGVQPQTAGNDLAHLGAVLSVARSAWGCDIDPHAMADARKVLAKQGYKLKSRERDRRPSLKELDLIFGEFENVLASRPTSINMLKVSGFAIFSTRRQDEICRIRWDDLDESRQAVMVRDMKNPGDKIGNNVWCYLPDEAWVIMKSMPHICDEIFPYNSESVSTAWSRACERVRVKDLHFHDLRHDGVSRLFEIGWDIPRVASVSGHRDWNSLRRYTHLNGHGDPYIGWEWLPKVLASSVKFGDRTLNGLSRRGGRH